MHAFLSTSLIALTLLSMRQCSKEPPSETVPACIRAKIKEIVAEDVWNPPAKVYSYVYNEQKVYYITARCCDIPSQLYTGDCTLICNPDGGYTGKGDNKCPDFSSVRKSEKLIWEDKREP